MIYPKLHEIVDGRKRFALEADTSPGFIDTTRALQLALEEIRLWREQHCGCYETPTEGYTCKVHRRLRREAPMAEQEAGRPDLLDGHPRDWNYRIFVRGCGGVTVRVWDYEAPQEEEFVLHETQVDPRETKDPDDVEGQIRLAFRRIADMHADRLYELKQAAR